MKKYNLILSLATAITGSSSTLALYALCNPVNSVNNTNRSFAKHADLHWYFKNTNLLHIIN